MHVVKTFGVENGHKDIESRLLVPLMAGDPPSIYRRALGPYALNWGLVPPHLLVELLCTFGLSNPGGSRNLKVHLGVSPTVRKSKIFSPLTPGIREEEKSPLLLQQAWDWRAPGTTCVSHPRAHLTVTANIFFLAGFIKPRSLEVGE